MPKYRHDELEHINEAYRAGRELAEAGLLEDAIQYFDQVLGRLPRRRRDRVYRFEHTPSGKKVDGVLWLPTIFRDALMAKVYCLNELGRFHDAYVLLERAIELDPENPQVYAEIGFAHGAQDNLEMARAAYRHAADLEPANPAHLRALAHLALLTEHFPEAQVLALEALRLDADSLASLHQLAYARYRMDDMDGAIVTLKRAVEIAPEDRESVLRLVGTLREAGRLREAIKYLEAFLTQDDTDPESLGIMTDLLQQDGTAPELFTHAHRLLLRRTNDTTALDLLAWGYYQQGNIRESLDILRKLVIIEPMQPHHHFKLGLIYETLGKLPQAMASLLRTTALDDTGEIGHMAMDAISNLDQVQIEQILARAESDVHFRYQLRNNPEIALLHAGYLLSPLGFQMLQTVDFTRDLVPTIDLRPRTIH